MSSINKLHRACSVIICCFKMQTEMSVCLTSANRVQRLWLLFPRLIIYFLTILSYGVEAGSSTNVTNVGAIINVSSRIGKEQKTAMEIAADSFNNLSKTHKLILHFRDSGRDPFLAASAAEELIKEKKVEVIVGMETWQEAAQVADLVGNQTQIPVISFAAPSITPPLMQPWPFLIRMATNGSAQMKCIAEIVSAYHWKKVIVVYEDDGYGGDVGMLALLTEALQDVGSKIEHRLVLPLISTLSNPNWVEIEEMLRLPTMQARVFIILQSSLPTVTNLFRLAGKMGIVGKESAWIITESIASLLDPQHTSDMKGTLGIKTYYAKNTSSYTNFRKKFQTRYSEGNSAQPGIYALRAYDAIGIISQAIGRMTDNTTSLEVLKTVLSSYTGLSANMQLNGGDVLSSPVFRIVKILDENGFQELDYWKPKVGFSSDEAGKYGCSDVGGVICLPGNLTSVPKGWAMPTVEKPMRIGVPGNASFRKFVKVDRSRQDSDKKKYVGFCIEIFDMVRNRLNYSLPYQFEVFDGLYDDLVEQVHKKVYDAVVGDITVLADRLDKVEFTQPYMESGLAMIVPAKPKKSTWMFMKPFTWQMWAVTGSILIYTVFIVWFLERPSNPAFGGPLKNQIGTATWFTFSSLFFAHKEKIYSNLTQVVVVVWLFVVLILTSSYTANLTSMLTIERPKPNATYIDTNSKVGCDGDTFVITYLQKVLGFKNIINVTSEYEYLNALKNKTIEAAFLELPYAEVFMNEHCEGYTVTATAHRFGGLSFIFQRGSPIARDFTKVILELLENGEVKKIQNEWLTPEKECPRNATSNEPESLTLSSFTGLYVISATISTLCFLLSFTTRLIRRFQHQEATQEGSASPSPTRETLWNKAVRMAKNLYTREIDVPTRSPIFPFYPEWSSSIREYSTTSTTPQHPHQTNNPPEIECIPSYPI